MLQTSVFKSPTVLSVPLHLLRLNIHFLTGQNSSKPLLVLSFIINHQSGPLRSTQTNVGLEYRLSGRFPIAGLKGSYQYTLPEILLILWLNGIQKPCCETTCGDTQQRNSRSHLKRSQSRTHSTSWLNYPILLKNPGKLHILDSVW